MKSSTVAMAKITITDLEDRLQLDTDIAERVILSFAPRAAEREVRALISDQTYDDVVDEDEEALDRLKDAEALLAFASYIGARGGVRLSEQGGLVRDLGIINQQQTIRQLLSQGEVERVKGRLRAQAERILDDLTDPASILWAA